MNPDERQKVLLDLFVHPGWRLVMDEMEEAHDILIRTTHLLETVEQLHRRKGEINQLQMLTGFEHSVKAQIAEEDREREEALEF